MNLSYSTCSGEIGFRLRYLSAEKKVVIVDTQKRWMRHELMQKIRTNEQGAHRFSRSEPFRGTCLVDRIW